MTSLAICLFHLIIFKVGFCGKLIIFTDVSILLTGTSFICFFILLLRDIRVISKVWCYKRYSNYQILSNSCYLPISFCLIRVTGPLKFSCVWLYKTLADGVKHAGSDPYISIMTLQEFSLFRSSTWKFYQTCINFLPVIVKTCCWVLILDFLDGE